VLVVDLLPGDLPVDRALRLLRRLEPNRLGTDPFYTPGGGHEAVALDPTVTARIVRDPARANGDTVQDRSDRQDRGALVRRTIHAQRYAPTATAVRVAPRLRTAPSTPADRWRELEELLAPAWPYGSIAPLAHGLETAHLLAMTAGVLVAPVPALAALVTWSLQPALVLGATPEGTGEGAESDDSALSTAQPLRESALRLPKAIVANLRVTAAGIAATRRRARRRAATPIPAPPPQDALFEPRRATCPWCESTDLGDRLDVTDLLQHKPGTFHLDECRACGHIFQNPALSQVGLDYYYEDAYDGIGEELAETSFAALGAIYRNRAASLARANENPEVWLDVGTGHAHFPLAARERWPELTIDGLDMSDTVEEAQRRGRIDTAYRGMFPELVDDLPCKYDVLSMHHYIEHTREPRQELDAAAKLLNKGGYLMIEMPDPASPWAKRLGRFWWQWGQPQHQHFVTCEAMTGALGERGFDVVSVERGPATMGGDMFNAVGLRLQLAARSPHLPWLPPVGLGQRVRRVALYTAAVPAMAVTKVADEIYNVLLRRPGAPAGNAYRIIARRR
jgi:ubiquinone/menaquinone biosynthesis C-methylase UbiE